MGKKDFLERKDILEPYILSVAHALKSKPTPSQSNFYLHGALLTSEGRLFTGGNHEYGIMRAIHTEETLIAKFLEDRLPKERIEAIAFHNPLIKSESSRYFIAPCGNCRDLIKKYSTNPIIISGNYEKNLAIAIPFKKLLFENFKTIGIKELSELEREIIIDMMDKKDKNIIPPENNIYTAAINIGRKYFEGTVLGRNDYNPILPIEAAINIVKSNGYQSADKIIISIGKKQEIPYKDRQALFELSKKVEHEIPIIIFSSIKKNENYKISKVWKTNSNEWLPYAFGRNIKINNKS